MTYDIESVDIDRLPGQLRDAATGVAQLDDVTQQSAEVVAAAGDPPVDTGQLANSLTVRDGTIAYPVVHASPVHWGWRRDTAVVAARPWLLAAADQARSDVADLGERHIIESLERID